MMKKQKNVTIGAACILFVFCLLFFLILYRFLDIQFTGVAAGQHLASIAEQKYVKNGVIEAKRGTIYDQNGEVIAEDTSSYTLVAIIDEEMGEGNYVKDKEKTAKVLAKYIDLEEDEIVKILSKEGLFQVEFGKAGRDIPLEVKREIEQLNLDGITFIRGSKRFYPNGTFASHVIGFSETPDGETTPIGKLGIEKKFNDVLTGENGSIQYKSDRWGYPLPNGKEQIKGAKDGYDIYLTIDQKIQTYVEDALTEVQNKYNPESMVVIVADPKTGNILAMGQRPTFNPETREGIGNTWLNHGVEVSIEPGSTVKMFTLAAALEENVLNLNETYQSGSFKPTKNSQTIRDHNYSGWGSISYLEGIQRSSNVAIAKMVKEKLGYDRFREYLTKFGFDQPTGIELPNETTGKIVYTYPIDKITTGYGQGTTVTPIQIVQAATAIANDGKMMKPQIIDKIVDPNTGKVVQEREPEVVGEPISEKTAKKVREVLETVVSSPKGTGYKRYDIEGYEVAGKTGTANITENGVYLKGRNDYLYSFLGMAPADEPELIVYIAVKQPKLSLSQTGSEPVSTIFRKVMKNSLQYLSIEPTDVEPAETVTVPDVTDVNVEEAMKKIEGVEAEPVIVGSGKKIAEQIPRKGTRIIEGEKVILRTDGELTVPDFKNWSLRDVMKVAEISQLEIEVEGSGYVTSQSVKPGEKVKKGDKIKVKLVPYNKNSTNKESEKNSE